MLDEKKIEKTSITYSELMKEKEYKVGEEITLVVKEKSTDTKNYWEGCFFYDNYCCYNPTYNGWKEGFQCGANERSDNKSVIFAEKK